MRILLLILLFPFLATSQTVDTCFTAEQIQDISYTLDSLYQLNSINDSIIMRQTKLIDQQDHLIKLDSLQLDYKTKQVALLQDNILLYVAREKQFKPKWYDSKSIWYGLGLATSILIFEIIK
jgi:hypothetical protein